MLVAIMAVMVSAWVVPASARTVEDAHYDTGSSASYVLGKKKYSESFTTGHRGKITKAFIETFNEYNTPATHTVEIWAADASGLPTGTAALTTVSHPASGYDFEFAGFSTPLPVRSGHHYALVVTVPDSANNGVTVTPGTPCPGTFSLNQTGSGAFVQDASGRDMVFAIYVTFRHRHHR